MTGKDILLKALRREPAPRTAWLPFVGVHGAQLIGASAADYLQSSVLIVQGLKKAYELYKPDGLPVMFDLQMEAEIFGCELMWSDESPPSVATHPLSQCALNDLPVFDPAKGRFPIAMEALRLLKKEIGEEIAFYGLITGPFTLALHLMGNDLFIKMFDQGEEVKKVLAFCAEAGKKAAEAYIGNGADVIAVVDPMTSQISPAHFEEYVADPINAVFDHVRGCGAYSAIFVCGDASRNLEVMGGARCDNISIDENISLEKLKEIGERYGKSIGGNLKLTVALLLGQENDVRLDAIRCLDACGGPGFILAPGCDIPWGVPPENLQAAAEMIHDEYKRETARLTLRAGSQDLYDDVVPPDYAREKGVRVEIITLDSTSCAPCQYMLEAAHQAAEIIGQGVTVQEYKIKTREGLGMMVKLGVRNIPTICIDGEPRFVSLLPDRNALVAAIRERLEQKEKDLR
ncbi:MAG: uroporphyrinogen decarboxylase family protein [Candidatus Omnitrophota bacterium]